MKSKWKAHVYLAASEFSPNTPAAGVFSALWGRLIETAEKVFAEACQGTPSFSGGDKFWCHVSISYEKCRSDRLTKEDVVYLIQKHRASIEGKRAPTPEEFALWEAARNMTLVMPSQISDAAAALIAKERP